jgi:predicted dehydrogenase
LKSKKRKDIKVSIIGCGQIAEAHLKEISYIKNVRVVGVCDRIRYLAEDAAMRFCVKEFFTDYKQMIEKCRPNVVHITTPPTTHLRIGLDVLDLGCHTYIEKPVGLNLGETRELIETAVKNKLILCPGFSQTYDLVAQRMAKHVGDGRIGNVVHLETYYGNSLQGSFSRIFLQDKEHWINKIPGKLFQNIISHAIYHVTPFLNYPFDEVHCIAFDRSRNDMFNDELRVMIRSGKVTAYITFTSNVQPITQFVRIYGTKGIAEMDLGNHAIYFYETTTLPGPFARVHQLIQKGERFIREGIRHGWLMASGRDRFFAGMGNLLEKFYENIRSKNPLPPISYDEVFKSSALMDEIVRQCNKN